MGDSGPVDVCEKEGARECMRVLVYSDMHTHRVHGMWVCVGACVQIRVKCVRERVFVYLRVHVCICAHMMQCLVAILRKTLFHEKERASEREYA